MSALLTASDHTYVVCAYKGSRYLTACLASLKNQTIESNVIVATSTPNELIKDTCSCFDVPLYVGKHKSGIARDWNFALNCAKTPLVTIAHQDDVYKPMYTERMLEYINAADNPLVFFSSYTELRNNEEVTNNRLLKIKKLMLSLIQDGKNSSSVRTRRAILSIGDPIACPAITYVTPNLPTPLFKEDYKGSLDWQMLEEISKIPGDFMYCSTPLMSHRIHRGSETSALIKDNTRTQEDYDMFCKFWPKPFARILSRLYSKSEDSNA